MKPDELLNEIENYSQKLFNEKTRPIIEKEMKKMGIVKIKHIMGVNFFTMKNGKCFSEDEFCESTEKRKDFYKKWIFPFGDRPLYTLINYDIDLTK